MACKRFIGNNLYCINKRCLVTELEVDQEKQVRPQRRFNRNRLGKMKLHAYFGFLGKGKHITNAKRRNLGGRYNYFDWPTLVRCINNCPSVIERDRMPSKFELNYMYRGASKGVKHHGGFEVVAQILNLNPRMYYLINEFEYPTWIEEEQIERKTNEINNIYKGKAIGPPHKHELPKYINNIDMDIVNIQGKTLSRSDKRRIIKSFYKKINLKLFENDRQRRKFIQNEWNEYKKNIQNAKVLNEYNEGLIDSYVQRDDGFFEKLSHIESKHKYFDSLYMQRRTKSDDDTHINLLNKKDMHINTKFESPKKGIQRIKSKIDERISKVIGKSKET